MLTIHKKFFLRSSSPKKVGTCLTAFRVGPGHGVRLVQQSRELLVAALSQIVVRLVWSSGVIYCVDDHRYSVLFGLR